MVQKQASVSRVATVQEQSTAPTRVCMYVLAKGRTDVRVMREAVSLVEAGLRVTLVDIESDRPSREEMAQGVLIKHARVPSWRVLGRFKPWALTKISQMFSSMFTVIRTSADVYHAHDMTALPACYLAAVLRHKPLVFDAHELPVTDPSITRRPLLRWVTTLLMRWMIPRCNSVITVSPPIAPEIQRRFGGPAVTLVRNLPSYQAVARTDRLRHYLHLPPETRIALYQGGFQLNRALDSLVSAAPFLAPHTIIALLGWGPDQARLEALIQETGVGDRVKIVPRVPYEELLEWTASADIGLTLFLASWSVSIAMCLPNKLFEYMMAGLPVLTTPLEAIVEIVERYGVGRVAPSLEPAVIGAAINDLLDDHVALERMRANALRASQQDLHWAVESQRLITLYQQLLLPKVGAEAGTPLVLPQ
jgi:glycosyltransferase involved in cell wall biosynthesis